MIKFHIKLLRFLKKKRTFVNASSFLLDFYKDDEPLKWRVYQVLLDSIAAGYIETGDHDPKELEKFINRAETTPGLINLRIKIAGEHELDRLEGWKLFTKQNFFLVLGTIAVTLLTVYSSHYLENLPKTNTSKPVINQDSTHTTCEPN